MSRQYSISRPSSWKRRLSRASKLDMQCTVLHAVPAGPISPMTPLEIAMATSPNEEILIAINKDKDINYLNPHSLPSDSNEWNRAPSAERQARDERLQPSGNRIGVWRDGVTVWDNPMQHIHPAERCNYSSEALRDDNNTPTSATAKPTLSVLIPGKSPQRYARQQNAKYRSSLVEVAEASVSVSEPGAQQYAKDPSVFVYEGPLLMVSSSNESSDNESSQLARSSRGHSKTRVSSLSTSRSSMSSGTAFAEESSDLGSCYSGRTSMTSVDEAVEDVIENPEWDPLNVPKRSVSAAFSITSPVEAGVFDEPPWHGDVNSSEGTAHDPAVLNAQRPASPTLSEVVCDLQTQLGTIVETSPLSEARLSLGAEAASLPAPARAPTIPKKSRKREWRASSLGIPKAVQASPPPANSLERRLSAPTVKRDLLSEPSERESCEIKRSSSVRLNFEVGGSTRDALLATAPHGHDTRSENARSRSASILSTPSEAQNVLLQIMASLHTLDDLLSMATINKGMYQVFKNNQMFLIRAVLRNTSLTAWELREWCPVPFSDVDFDGGPMQYEHTPATYVRALRQDNAVIDGLRVLILERCQSFLRPETVAALSSPDGPEWQRYEDAFYRIWCFCKIFGCEKGREDDVAGQLDWLKGGELAHQQDCAATVNINLEFEITSVLLNPPEHFAKGNPGGVSPPGLYDMTELWNCLIALLQGYEGRIDQALTSGIFEHLTPFPTTIEEQSLALEEWLSYILTLGPPVILELAKRAQDPSDTGFAYARLNAWTDWAMPTSGNSRSTFLKEPVARLYEERMTASALLAGVSQRLEQKELSRRRVASLAAEIRLSRSSSTYHRLPLIDMAHERAMSVLERRDSVAPTLSGGDATQSPTSPFGPPKRVSPIIEERVENFNRLSLLSLNGHADDTAERAVGKIVAMGFSSNKAKEALRLTDMGNGLRVDRAVDLLLRQY